MTANTLPEARQQGASKIAHQQEVWLSRGGAGDYGDQLQPYSCLWHYAFLTMKVLFVTHVTHKYINFYNNEYNINYFIYIYIILYKVLESYVTCDTSKLHTAYHLFRMGAKGA